MSTIWVMKFVPYGANAHIDTAYKTEEEATRVYTSALACGEGERFEVVDSFGIKVAFHPSKGILVLTNTAASADFTRAIDQGNNEARGSSPFAALAASKGPPQGFQ